MKLGHKTSDFSPRFSHLPSAISHLNDCEELVKILVSRCKKLDEQLKEEKKLPQTSDLRPQTSDFVHTSDFILQTSDIVSRCKKLDQQISEGK